MRFIFNLLIIGIILVPVISQPSPPQGSEFVLPTLDKIESDIHNLWSNFKKAFDIVYNTTHEDLHRLKVFAGHVKLIIKHNLEYDLGLQTYRLGLNKFSALTDTEFHEQLTGFRLEKNSSLLSSNIAQPFTPGPPLPPLPVSVDWRQRGIITPVKNQGQCGACWAFSTAGALESYYALATGKLVDLSEQELMDCSIGYGNYGCRGGLMNNAFRYVHDKGGLVGEMFYPYTMRDGFVCRAQGIPSLVTCDGYVPLPRGDEKALQTVLAYQGPVSIGINANPLTFRHYQSGVYSDPTCTSQDLNHAVLAIGYGVQYNPLKGQEEYFILKNSWGLGWGENGYMKIARNKNNMCGITTDASYPIVNVQRFSSESAGVTTTEPTN